jgi:hypothetical protein
MSDSESKTARVPRDNRLFSGDGPRAPKNPDRSADPNCVRCSDGRITRYVTTTRTYGYVLLVYSPREPRVCSCIKSDY